jgi:uncharacterized protein YjiS (DUF1127 family)
VRCLTASSSLLRYDFAAEEIHTMEAIIHQAAAARADTVRTFLESIYVWYRRRRTTWVLQDLDDRLLDDIGIHREQIASVADRHIRAFW